MPKAETITSARNPLLQDVRRAIGRGGLTSDGLWVAETFHLLEEAVASRRDIRMVIVSASARAQADSSAGRTPARIVTIPDRVFQQLSATETAQGVMALVEPPAWTLADVFRAPALVAVLDGVQDPGNVGTMLRTALGLGAAGVVALTGTAELTNPKVVRGSMGALFQLPSVEAVPDDFLGWVERGGIEVWATAADGEPIARTELGPRDRRSPIALVVGNEGAGTSDRIMTTARRRLAVPLAAGVESLNVAVAAGILLHEVSRAD